MPTRVLIVDDHAIVRDGLGMILDSQSDITVVGQATDGRDAIVKGDELKPDVIIMDIAMPKLNGIEATHRIRRRLPQVKVVILSMHHTQEHVFRAMRAGADGYIMKTSAGAEVVKAVRTVVNGQRYIGRGVDPLAGTTYSEIYDSQKSPLDSLSPREREVLQYVVEGKTSVEIGDLLSLSRKSVETYRSRLMHKLGVHNVPSLVKFAVGNGITPAEYSDIPDRA
jgi:DNA-binding NarL/FixJ family response regulator